MRERTVRLKVGLAALTLAGVTGAAGFVRAQSLGEVAKKEEERRKHVKTPSKVYTNKDLSFVPLVPVIPADATKAPGEVANAAKADEKDKPQDTPQKDQAYWAGRKKELQAKLDRDQVLADAMQSRINGLVRDYAARDDPAQRAVLERDRQRAVAELGRLQQAAKDDKKALDDLDEEARKAGVPPGWLR